MIRRLGDTMKHVHLIDTKAMSLNWLEFEKAARAGDVSPDDGRVDVWHRKSPNCAPGTHIHVNGSKNKIVQVT